MAGTAASFWQTCGGRSLVDRPPRGRLRQERIPGATTWRLDQDGQLLPWDEIPPPKQPTKAQAEREVDLRRLWFLLPEETKKEFAGYFSRTVVKLLNLTSHREGQVNDRDNH